MNDNNQLLSSISTFHEEISIQTPFLCNLTKILKYNEEKDFLTAQLQDGNEGIFMGFFYGDLAKILSFKQASLRFPMEITIFKGLIKDLGKNKKYIEIHHAILENRTFINSNLLGTQGFCEMATYLRAYINFSSPSNNNQLWGNLLHDYLSYVFSSPYLREFSKNMSVLENFIISCFIKALYHNWSLIVVLGRDIDTILSEFKENFFMNELDFILQEMDTYTQKFKDFEYICEKMVYSKHLGLQGRIDRLVRDKSQTKFIVYETKTGTSSRSSKNFAYYQSMAYATMLQEFYPSSIDGIYIEYPRNALNERLIPYEYDYENLLKVLKMRNQIWTILIGKSPEIGPYLSCSKCNSKNACEFYCYRNNKGFFCKQHNQKCKYYSYFEQNCENRALFKLMDAYLTWFLHLLDQEFLANLELINEIHLPAQIREKKGNCIAELKIDTDSFLTKQSKNQGKIILESPKFVKSVGNIENTRLRKGDFILLTPQNYIPLTSESVPGTIKNISANSVTLDLFRPLDTAELQNIFRIDLTTTNYLINQQRTAVDSLIRLSIIPENKNLERLRELLLFQSYPKLGSKLPIELKPLDPKFDESQQKAIFTALKSKDMMLIQGPPGTGKTTIIVEIIHNLIKQFKIKNNTTSNKKKNTYSTIERYLNEKSIYLPPIRPILVTAYSNKAVDNILLKLLKIYPKTKVIRIGNIHSIDSPEILSHNIEYMCKKTITLPTGEIFETIDPLKVRLILENSEVIATTTSSAGTQLLQNFHFNTVILDEAAQIVETSALIPLIKGDKFILVGDHQQLPPITQKITNTIPIETQNYMETLGFTNDKGVCVSIFERLSKKFKSSTNFVLLDTHYRMNRIISGFVSEKFYENKLHPGEVKGKNVGDQNLDEFFLQYNLSKFNFYQNNIYGLAYDPDTPMVFIDTKEIHALDSSTEIETKDLDSRFNNTEVEIVVKLIFYFLQQIIENHIPIAIAKSIIKAIGIISGYRAQNQKIKQNLFDRIKNFNETQKDIDKLNNNDLNELINELVVDTVDRFQGQEREIIIYSFVDSNRMNLLSSLHLETRRLNVAISRAKKKIIFIGNSDTIAKENVSDKPDSITAKKLHSDLIHYIQIQLKNPYYILNEGTF